MMHRVKWGYTWDKPPMLGQIKKTAVPAPDADQSGEYYRLRSFSITPNGICNLGDSFKSRRSKSISSVNSTCSSTTTMSNRERVPSNASQMSGCLFEDVEEQPTPAFKVAMLGAAGVGKTALTYQFTTSEYICAYDTSLDEEFGQKTVSVLLDGQEAELEVIDHPASEMSVESFCSTYNPDVFVVVYSVIDRKSFKVAEDMLLYLWKHDYMASKGVILVGNKADLERKREIPLAVGRKLANGCSCKFIETSSGLDHNVDELLVGILAQVKLNPRRDRDQMHKKRKRQKVRMGSGKRILKHLLGIKRKAKSCENLLVL
ncbi:ras-related protein Rap-2a isoform X1 [Nilaparvata lugens]|uniref:ras-related protein Rap-2a isoform X1 n=1 Tax=Nilaparvata lugens TaxID=108931 RepID=UPI00193DA0A0|nr:ras-related protein Rap-2a isoform X1 [Nilaparvata lugens]